MNPRGRPRVDRFLVEIAYELIRAGVTKFTASEYAGIGVATIERYRATITGPWQEGDDKRRGGRPARRAGGFARWAPKPDNDSSKSETG